MTLFEVVVVIAIMGILAAVVGGQWRTGSSPDPSEAWRADVVHARRLAVLTGSGVTVEVVDHGKSWTVTALPDGRVVGPPGLAVHSLSGKRLGPEDVS